MNSPTGGTKTRLAPFRLGKLNHLGKPALFNLLDNQLSYPLTLCHLKRFHRVSVNEQNLQLSPIPRIHKTWGI